MARAPATPPPEYQPQPPEGPEMPGPELLDVSFPETEALPDEQPSPAPPEIPDSI